MSQRLVLGHVQPTSVDPPVTGWTRRPRRGGSSFLSGHSRDGLSLLACLLFGEQRLRRSRRKADGAIVKAPQNLYELLGVTDNADSDQIKKAYHDKMKICHPDIAGDDGEEICILLNDAYDVLSDPDEKKVYDEELNRANGNYKPVLYLEPGDLSPTWEWTSKNGNKKSKPEYKGRPLSRSLHHKVAPEDQGEKWTEEKFVFVDEWTCIACRNCCDVAPRTFCIDADAGRARVFAQWGNGEELLDYAVQACPVDCIYWVSRDELQVLEHVTRDRMFENGNTVPCSMAARQGTGGGLEDPFGMATKFQAKLAEEEERRKRMAEQGVKSASILEMQERIGELFGKLSERLRQAGWG